ncbi:MAG: sugar isomerase [Planctomycetes bacterium]|nr:sugar isomerase [Planctomycetota bacterium]
MRQDVCSGAGQARPRCCPCERDVSRRGFLEAAGGAALVGLSWSLAKAAEAEVAMPPARKPLVLKPIFTYGTYAHRHQSSWRPWGGVETQPQANDEIARINEELQKLRAAADFPLNTLPLTAAKGANDIADAKDLADADAVLVYASSGPLTQAVDAALAAKKNVIIFVRHKSGPLYLWYEIISPRYLRRHSDRLAVQGVDFQDVVVDSQDELLWRLRALCGLKNAQGARILAIGGPGGWAQAKAPALAKERWGLDIQTVTYEELRKLIQEARADNAAVALAKKRADDYLKADGVKLETKREFVDNCFLLDQVFRALMKKAEARAITVNACMGTIMPVSETTACLTLTTLNDDGYMAFCESDFVIIPAGILLDGITGHPTFLHNPCYPHGGQITLAHCTGPRKMDGKKLDPVRIVTHYESDYGAAPKVEIPKGQRLTHVLADFEANKWHGLASEVIEAPFYPICRTQVEVQYKIDDALLAEKMHGFHWMTVYGNYLRELGYALRRTAIKWENLG